LIYWDRWNPREVFVEIQVCMFLPEVNLLKGLVYFITATTDLDSVVELEEL
jgi:hypothetical protein